MKNVVVYTSKTCSYCVKVKKFLKLKGISYTEKDTSDPVVQAEFASKGFQGVPTLLIGEDIVEGYDPDKIEYLIDYIVTPCPNCETKIRLPKNKGKIVVACPKCKNDFKMET